MGNIINCTCRMIMSCCRLNHCYTIFPCKCQPPLPRGNRPQMAHRAKSCSSSFILSSCGLIFARPLYTFCCGLSEALHPAEIMTTWHVLYPAYGRRRRDQPIYDGAQAVQRRRSRGGLLPSPAVPHKSVSAACRLPAICALADKRHLTNLARAPDLSGPHQRGVCKRPPLFLGRSPR